MIVIGVAGTNGAGKDTVAELLARDFGFVNASATTMLGDELTRRGQSHERKNKAALSAEWRREHGMGVIVDKAVEMFKSASGKPVGVVVGSLRHPGEADRVHELGGTMLWVDADPKVRYERVKSNNRGRVEDNKTYEEFLAEQKQEMTPVGDHATLDIASVKERCDVFVMNNSNDFAVFESEIKKALKL